MTSLFLLLVISLTMTSPQAKNKFYPFSIATNKLDAPPINSGAHNNIEKLKVAIPVALADAATPPAIAIIEAQARELSMQSETDAPFVVKFFPSQQIELAPDAVAALVERSADKTVEIVTVTAFFKNSVAVETWMNDDEKATARKFQLFVQTLETQLENPRVYLFGERERTVVIIGKVKGGFGGVVTLVVET